MITLYPPSGLQAGHIPPSCLSRCIQCVSAFFVPPGVLCAAVLGKAMLAGRAFTGAHSRGFAAMRCCRHTLKAQHITTMSCAQHAGPLRRVAAGTAAGNAVEARAARRMSTAAAAAAGAAEAGVARGTAAASVGVEAGAASTISSSSPAIRAVLTRPRSVLFGNSISSLFGHSAFILAGTAFLDPDILNLRLLSVAAGGCTIIFSYFHPVGKPLWLPLGWNLVFMGINGAHIYRILSERWQAERLPPQALELWQAVFAHHGVGAVDFSKLLSAGTWTTFRKGVMLQQEGEASSSVFLLVTGGADVSFHGKKSHRIRDHQFVGDMGLSSGITLTVPVRGVANVMTNQQTTCLVWGRKQLASLLDSNPKLAHSFQAAVGADVLRKMRDTDAVEDEETGKSQRAVQQEMWRARYESILASVLSAGEVTSLQRQQLHQFRDIHHVTEAEHTDFLMSSGWSTREYEEGQNPRILAAVRRAEVTERADRRALNLEELEGASQAGGAETPDGLPLSVRPPRSSRVGGEAAWAPSANKPLDLWDARKSAVVAVQERLNVIFGAKALTVDGNFGPLTQQAVELFQIKNGLPVRGNVGPETWSALRTLHLQRLEQDSLLDLVRGFDDKVDIDVAMLQQKLQLVVGKECCKVDGIYGPRTTKAVAMFLQQQGLATRRNSSSSSHVFNMHDSERGTRAGESSGGSAVDEAVRGGGSTSSLGMPQQLTAQAQALLHESYLSELEAKALSAVDSDGPLVADEDVKLLQISLNQVMGEIGGVTIKPDGVWGPKTRRAIEEFQTLYGMPLGGDLAEQLKTVSMVLRAAATEAEAAETLAGKGGPTQRSQANRA